MKKGLLVQLAVITACLIGAALLVIDSADGWADWVVFGVIVATALGMAVAVNRRRYTTKRRTFVKSYERPRGPR
jgi:hypothetical protein